MVKREPTPKKIQTSVTNNAEDAATADIPVASTTPPLFRFNSRFISKSDITRSRHGHWEVNPQVLHIPQDSDPNTGKGFDLAQLEMYYLRLTDLRTKVRGEIKKRGGGPKPKPIITIAYDLFVDAQKHGKTEPQAWKDIWDHPEMRGNRKTSRRSSASKIKIRSAVHKRLIKNNIQTKTDT